MTFFARIYKFSFSQCTVGLSCLRLLISLESICNPKFFAKIKKMSMESENKRLVFNDAMSQCGDALTVDEENILVMRMTSSPVPPCDIEATENLQVSDYFC